MNTFSEPHPVPHGQRGLNYARGIGSALVCGTIGFFSLVLIGLTLTVCRWWTCGFNDFDRAYDLRFLPTNLALPAVGTVILFAAAGWASFAPNVRHRFVSTLLAVTGVSIPTWFVLVPASEALGIWHRPYKGEPVPFVDPFVVFLIAVGPVVTAMILSRQRSRRGLAGVDDKRAFDEL